LLTIIRKDLTKIVFVILSTCPELVEGSRAPPLPASVKRIALSAGASLTITNVEIQFNTLLQPSRILSSWALALSLSKGAERREGSIQTV